MKELVLRLSKTFLFLLIFITLVVHLNPKRSEQDVAKERMLDYWSRFFLKCGPTFYTFSIRQNNFIAINTDPNLWVCQIAPDKTGSFNDVWDVTIQVQSSAFYDDDRLVWSQTYEDITGYWKGHFSSQFLSMISTRENYPFKVQFQLVNNRTFELLSNPNHPVNIFKELKRPTSCELLPLMSTNNSK